MYIKNDEEKDLPKIFDKGANNPRWEVIASLSDG